MPLSGARSRWVAGGRVRAIIHGGTRSRWAVYIVDDPLSSGRGRGGHPRTLVLGLRGFRRRYVAIVGLGSSPLGWVGLDVRFHSLSLGWIGHESLADGLYVSLLG